MRCLIALHILATENFNLSRPISFSLENGTEIDEETYDVFPCQPLIVTELTVSETLNNSNRQEKFDHF